LIDFLAYLEPKLWLKYPVFDKNQKLSQNVTLAISGQIWSDINWQQIELESYSNPLKTGEVL